MSLTLPLNLILFYLEDIIFKLIKEENTALTMEIIKKDQYINPIVIL